MPKLERLDWVAPLSEGRGVTLSDDPEADRYLAEDPNALLLGVLYDSQYATRKAFAVPLRLKERLGHLDMQRLAGEPEETVMAAFSRKPALHRFPNKFARLTQQFAQEIVMRYGGDGSRVWREAVDLADVGNRLLQLPAFGEDKTNWTIGMLGRLGLLSHPGWEDYRVTIRRRTRSEA
jgi:uncharacterized HhH-GPD family protein